MNHDEVQLLAARCLVEPAFLKRALALARATEPSTRSENCSRLPEEATAVSVFGLEELERIELFNGFITKVKHGSVRKVLPCTLRLLGELKIELDFFVEFSTGYSEARAGGPLPMEAHLSLLEERLLPYLANLPPDVRNLVRDVFLHETTLWRAAKAQKSDSPGSEEGINWRGCFLVQRYSTDVEKACQALSRLAFRGGSYSVEAGRLLAYWRAWESTEVTVFEIDELTALIFGAVDGARSIPAIAAAFTDQGLSDITEEDLKGFFEEASDRGFVRLPREAELAGSSMSAL